MRETLNYNGGDSWYGWLKDGLDLYGDMSFAVVMKRLAKELKKYTPASLKKAKEEDLKLLNEVKSCLKDAEALLKKARKIGLHNHVEEAGCIQDLVDKLKDKQGLNVLVLDIKETRNQ